MCVLLLKQPKVYFGLLDPTVNCWQLCHCTLNIKMYRPDSASQVFCHPHCMRNVLAALQSVLESNIADGRPQWTVNQSDPITHEAQSNETVTDFRSDGRLKEAICLHCWWIQAFGVSAFVILLLLNSIVNYVTKWQNIVHRSYGGGD